MDHSSAASAPASVSAGIAAANAHLPHTPEPGLRFPQEDAGRSLAEMAARDLDAALQLLAERAQYITGATGAAIALRRGLHNDMLCRASSGSNAPELGALLSMEYGLSGESARTRQTLVCDDAERDPRVNREGCRQLGIASVVVIPIVSEDQSIGVFELFSGQPHAFAERDISALRRLGEMVETAVQHALAAQNVLATQTQTSEPPAEEAQPTPSVDATALASPVSATDAVSELAPQSTDSQQPQQPDLKAELKLETSQVEIPNPQALAPPNEASPPPTIEPPISESPKSDLAKTESQPVESEAVEDEPLFWSAALQAQRTIPSAEEIPPSIPVPPVLRNLQKCQACGFPVSQGRTLCVDCEQKQWRGEPLPQTAAAQAPLESKAAPQESTSPAAQKVSAIPLVALPDLVAPTSDLAQDDLQQDDSQQDLLQEQASAVEVAEAPFLSSAMPSESWLAANKFILAALLVVAIIVGVIVWLH